MGRINWPEKHLCNKNMDYNDCGQCGACLYNRTINACIAAEKESRVGVEEILAETLDAWKGYYAVAPGYVMHSSEIECCQEIAHAIQKAIYGEEEQGIKGGVEEWKNLRKN